MNIGFVFIHPPGESMGSLYRVRNLCQGLTNESHKCYIFTPFNYKEDWGPLVDFIQIPTFSSKGKYSTLIYKGIRKVLDSKFFSRFTILNPKFFNITIERISNGLIDILKRNSITLDAIIGESEIGGLILINIKNELKIPTIVDYQNYWPLELVEHKIIKENSKRYKQLVELEKKIISNGDFIITISKALEDFLKTNFGNNSKIQTVHNGGLAILNKPKKKEFPPKIINSGLVVHRSNFKLFLESLPYVLKKYPETQIFVTRKGEKLKEVMKLAKNLKLKINFYWKETVQEYLDLLSECHVGVVTSTYELSRQLGIVAKIYDYFSVGVPVVANDIGGWISMISQEKVGFLSTNDPKDLADKIIKLIENPEISYEYGLRGINLLKKDFSVKTSALNLLKCIETIL